MLVSNFKLKVYAFVNSLIVLQVTVQGQMFPRCSQPCDSSSSWTSYPTSTSIIWTILTLSITHRDIHSLFCESVWPKEGWATVLTLSTHSCVYGYLYIYIYKVGRAFCTVKLMESHRATIMYSTCMQSEQLVYQNIRELVQKYVLCCRK